MKTTADANFKDIHSRFVNSGEWDRIQAILISKSNEAGSIDELRSRVKERARMMDPLSFRQLLEEFASQSQTSVPPAVKLEIQALIKQFVHKEYNQ